MESFEKMTKKSMKEGVCEKTGPTLLYNVFQLSFDHELRKQRSGSRAVFVLVLIHTCG